MAPKQFNADDGLTPEAPVSDGLTAIDAIVGLVDDPSLPADVAADHDHYLYGAPRR